MRGKDLSEAAASAVIRQRLARLQSRGWIELAALPARSTDDVMVEGLQSHVTTYVDAPEQDRRWIVVELCTHDEPVLRIFRHRQCFVDGFEIRASGETRPLREEEMDKYM